LTKVLHEEKYLCFVVGRRYCNSGWKL